MDEIPSVQDLRWPLLVLIDDGGDEGIVDLEAHVAERFQLSDEARNAVDPDSGSTVLHEAARTGLGGSLPGRRDPADG